MVLPVAVDTDGGVDDCTALWWALASPALDVVAVTTVGGVVGPDQAARNVAKVLHAAGRPGVPIAVGGGEAAGDRGGRHGRDGLGDCGHPDVPFAPAAEPAPALLAGLDGVTLVALGPLTNVAAALGAGAAPAGLVVMGGGDGEFNAACDPAAARAVAAAPWPTPPLLVTLDAGFAATLHDEELAVLARRATPQAAFLACPIESYARAARAGAPDGGCPSHDTLAMTSLVHPGLLHVEHRPPWRVATGADGDRFRALMRTFFSAHPAEAAPEPVA